jgi:hypothetical protein
MRKLVEHRLSEHGSRNQSPNPIDDKESGHIKVIDSSDIAKARGKHMRSRSKADQRA